MNDKQLQTVLNIYSRALADIASGYHDLNSHGLSPVEMQALASRALSVGTGILAEKIPTGSGARVQLSFENLIQK
jgi:hypothetical protein